MSPQTFFLDIPPTSSFTIKFFCFKMQYFLSYITYYFDGCDKLSDFWDYIVNPYKIENISQKYVLDMKEFSKYFPWHSTNIMSIKVFLFRNSVLLILYYILFPWLRQMNWFLRLYSKSLPNWKYITKLCFRHGGVLKTVCPWNFIHNFFFIFEIQYYWSLILTQFQKYWYIYLYNESGRSCTIMYNIIHTLFQKNVDV